MLDMGQPPETTPVGIRVAGQPDTLAAAQRRQVRMTIAGLCSVVKRELMHTRVSGVGRKGHRCVTPNAPRPVSNDQAVTAPVMLEVVMQAFLRAQPLEKLQV
jgi:hypothetical protein